MQKTRSTPKSTSSHFYCKVILIESYKSKSIHPSLCNPRNWSPFWAVCHILVPSVICCFFSDRCLVCIPSFYLPRSFSHAIINLNGHCRHWKPLRGKGQPVESHSLFQPNNSNQISQVRDHPQSGQVRRKSHQYKTAIPTVSPDCTSGMELGYVVALITIPHGMQLVPAILHSQSMSLIGRLAKKKIYYLPECLLGWCFQTPRAPLSQYNFSAQAYRPIDTLLNMRLIFLSCQEI